MLDKEENLNKENKPKNAELLDENNLHRAGFVSIVGKPNVGKSTLMNQLVGENLAIITSKAQTTRHRIMGILSGDDYQIVYSDTPGIIQPKYELHKKMMRFVTNSLQDADVILFVTDIFEKFDENDVLKILQDTAIPIVLIINKIDLAEQDVIKEKVEYWKEKLNPKAVLALSALHNFNTESVLEVIKDFLPSHPAFFAKDTLTNKSERFFAAEIIREKIFLNYEKEIPYCCQVEIIAFDDKSKDDLIQISAEIYVERKSQKGIIIGKGGKMLTKVGTAARLDMEKFFGKRVYLQQFVKVEEDWRKHPQKLKRFGFEDM
jgi:GTP-binding protein Era